MISATKSNRNCPQKKATITKEVKNTDIHCTNKPGKYSTRDIHRNDTASKEIMYKRNWMDYGPMSKANHRAQHLVNNENIVKNWIIFIVHVKVKLFS